MSNSTYRIFLLNEELDCEDLNLSTSFSIADVTDISKRKDSISKNVKLKATSNNNRIFGNLYNLSREVDESIPEQLYYNYSPSVGVSCKIYENSTVIFTGELRIIEVNVDGFGNYEYNAVVTGALVNLFARIGEDLLTDIPGFTESHTYDLSTILNSWYHETSPAFVYPFIDYGAITGITNATKFDVSNIRTGIYLKTYFDKILSNYGYSYSGEFTGSDIFRKAYIPFNGQDFNQTVTGVTFSSELVDYGPLIYPLFPNAGLDSSIPVDVISDSTIVDNFVVDSDNRTANGYVFKKNITTPVKVTLSFTAYTSYVDPFYDVLIGNRYYTLTDSEPVVDSYSYYIPTKTYSTGDIFSLPIRLSTSPDNQLDIALDFEQVKVEFGGDDVITQAQIKLGDNIMLKDVIPQDIKVKDFIKSVQQFFNLYIIENPNQSNDLIIEPFDNFFSKCSNPKQHAIDWSKKVDYSNGYGQAFNIDLAAKYNFKFKEDTDFYNDFYKNRYNETYGNYSINNSKGRSQEKNIEVTFSPTVIVKANGDDKDIPTIFKGDITKKQQYKSNLRILFFNGFTPCKQYKIVEGNTDLQTKYNYPVSHHILSLDNQAVFNMQFGLPKEILGSLPLNADIFNLPNLYTTFYRNQIIESNDANVYSITVDVYLNSNDIATLDMRIPVFIQTKNGSGYFKILSVDYYSSTQPAKVVLQKINV